MIIIHTVDFSILDIPVDIKRQLRVSRAVCHEGLSRQPTCEITLVAVQPGLDEGAIQLSKWIGRKAVMDVKYWPLLSAPLGNQSDVGIRRYAGVVHLVTRAIATDGTIQAIRLELRAWPLAVTQGADKGPKQAYFLKGYRTFNDQTSLSVVREIFEINGGGSIDTSKLSNDSETAGYQTQYGESDYEFIARLIGEHNRLFLIDYAPPDTETPGKAPETLKCRLAVFDSLDGRPDCGLRLDRVSAPVDSNPCAAWDVRTTVARGPNTVALVAKSQSPADTRARLARDTEEGYAWIEVVNEQTNETTAQGEDIAARRIKVGGTPIYAFRCNHPKLHAGDQIKIGDDSLVITQLTQTLEMLDTQSNTSSTTGWKLTGEVEQAVRPEHAYAPPPLLRPRIAGVLRGIVLDANAQPNTIGTTDDKIVHTDAHGRIKVRMLWQDYEYGATKKDSDFAWLRMMTPWAGNQAGYYGLPRAGQEVIVSFVNGDPSQPIILGCLHGQTENTLPQPWNSNDPIQKSRVGVATHQPLSSNGKLGQHFWMDATRNNKQEENKGISLQSVSNINVQAETEIRMLVVSETEALETDKPIDGLDVTSNYIKIKNDGKIISNATAQIKSTSPDSKQTSGIGWNHKTYSYTTFQFDFKTGGDVAEVLGNKNSVVGMTNGINYLKTEFGMHSYKVYSSESKTLRNFVGNVVNDVRTVLHATRNAVTTVETATMFIYM